MSIKTFEDLEIWQEGKALAIEVFKMWQGIDARGYFALQDQMQRAALSISSNIAEGSERKSRIEYMRFLYVAKGSTAELRTQLYVLRELKLVSSERIDILLERTRILSKRIAALIFTLKRPKQD